MSYLVHKGIKPYHDNKCHCAEFLAPLTSWGDIVQRHDTQLPLRGTLFALSDTSEDYTIDLFQCVDCGRYWARENCGSPWVTGSLDFYYLLKIESPEKWLADRSRRTLLSSLSTDDPEYVEKIVPRIYRMR